MKHWDRIASAAYAGAVASAAVLVLLVGGAGEAAQPAGSGASAAVAPVGAKAPRYGRDIRPILSDRCFKCHGPDAGARQGKLRLDLHEEATAAREGRPAIVPGDPEGSELWHRINQTNPEEVMPPADSHKRALSDGEKGLLRAWIEAGAVYEPHWAFVAPVRPAVPKVAGEPWGNNPIDAFMLEQLRAEGIKPSPEADPASLLRRVFLDLTGLPPTPEELDEFLNDARPDAYERWVDRLLTTEPYATRYAERMAVPWMDQARYADTCGIHMDAGRQMWLWRDYVIHAYRDNMPFDRFITEQIGGDLIPSATEEQKIASGFNRNHVTTDEGGAIAEEYLVEYAVDRTATTGAVFLGLTVGCARCHDHKFDPVTQEDFYKLYAYFDSIEEPGLYSQTQDPQRAHEPFIVVPTAEQRAATERIGKALSVLREQQETRTPEEETQRTAFVDGLAGRAGVSWAPVTVASAAAASGATLEVMPDGSVRASGTNPARDDYEIVIRTEAVNLRTLLLEVLPEPTAFEGRVGRAPNGNAVVTGVSAEAVSVADPALKREVRFAWGWTNHSQPDVDSSVTNLIDGNPARGWAVDAQRVAGGRIAMLVSDEMFGFEGGTELRVTIRQQSIYDNHTLARVRLGLGTISEAGLALLPLASSRWYIAGPLPPDASNDVFNAVYGAEKSDPIDLKATFGPENAMWRFDQTLADGRVGQFNPGRNVTYVGKDVFSPTARDVEVSLGSDDAFHLYLNGSEVTQRNVERGAAPDQDRATLSLRPGRNTVVMQIANTGGPAGFYFRADEKVELPGDLVAGLLSPAARDSALSAKLDQAWRIAYLPSYKENAAKITALEQESLAIDAAMPRTMVMKELAEQRPTHILMRGVYDKPDMNRPVSRGVPAAFGGLPEGAPPDRLGLAMWLTSASNPLVARVAVNRLWELAFGTGLVRTSEDFGLQGEWPSHPELLDWLAVEFRESGWDVKRMVRLIVTSATYRQSSNVRPELKELDPDNRLLAFYPRHRLSAEQIRDQALYVSGLLVEQAGGPSVKPYQPEGLWQEVAMPQSNTREYVRGMGNELWRRSLYTYWKRAAPPPSMLTFDAPTREACTIRRASTSTPLQALVLWNDEQFVEAARVLAQRTLGEPGDDAARLTRLFRRCTARAPDEAELRMIEGSLAAFRERYRATPGDAAGLLIKGASPAPMDADQPELAAWTMIASAVMNLYEATTQE